MSKDAKISSGDELQVTTPKPFVFVLMPFREEFNDIYKYGIKGAASDAGAYAERVDEQLYVEGMLERVYNQINKADVIVADMTGQNPNVFYEVGYAHALGKLVILLTQDANDIPFDLKHRPHIVYQGSIDKLRTELAPRLAWAINESKNRGRTKSTENFAVFISGVEVPESSQATSPAIVTVVSGNVYSLVDITVRIRNNALGTKIEFSHSYLFTVPEAPIRVMRTSGGKYEGRYQADNLQAVPADAYDGLGLQHQLPAPSRAIPFGAFESFFFYIESLQGRAISQPLRLRLLSGNFVHDFPFRLEATFKR